LNNFEEKRRRKHSIEGWKNVDICSHARWVRCKGEELWFFVVCDYWVESKWLWGKFSLVVILFDQINHIFFMD